MKRAVADRVGWLPGAQEFLRRVRAAGKRLVLLTNSHPIVLQIKDERTAVTSFLDAAFSSHSFGVPKEDAAFWEAIRQVEPFDHERTLFVDDSPPVLRAARAAGIRWVYGVRLPSTATSGWASEPRDHGSFPAVDSIVELTPEGVYELASDEPPRQGLSDWTVWGPCGPCHGHDPRAGRSLLRLGGLRDRLGVRLGREGAV